MASESHWEASMAGNRSHREHDPRGKKRVQVGRHAKGLSDFVGRGGRSPKALRPATLHVQLLALLQALFAHRSPDTRVRQLLVREVAQRAPLAILAASSAPVELTRYAVATGVARGTKARHVPGSTGGRWSHCRVGFAVEQIRRQEALREGITRGVRCLFMREGRHETWRWRLQQEVGCVREAPVWSTESRLHGPTGLLIQACVDVPVDGRQMVLLRVEAAQERIAAGARRALQLRLLPRHRGTQLEEAVVEAGQAPHHRCSCQELAKA
mmetsp:Transcript_47666/g.153328  ORF Transcript_47666/g.153328 Transcript_47666/m.153328 type:complete len:269 (-) Transcript_47666:35-841(-)